MNTTIPIVVVVLDGKEQYYRYMNRRSYWTSSSLVQSFNACPINGTHTHTSYRGVGWQLCPARPRTIQDPHLEKYRAAAWPDVRTVRVRRTRYEGRGTEYYCKTVRIVFVYGSTPLATMFARTSRPAVYTQVKTQHWELDLDTEDEDRSL